MGAFDHMDWTCNGDLNSFSAWEGGNLNKKFPKIQMPEGLPGGMFKLRFDWYITCDQASLYFHGGKVHLIQLLDYLSVASPESGLFSDWSRNKRYLELSHNWFPVCQSR